MISTAKLFKNGQSQAVRLPKEYRFNDDNEVYIKKINGIVMLIPKNNNKSIWDSIFNSLEHISTDFMQERTEPIQERKELF